MGYYGSKSKRRELRSLTGLTDRELDLDQISHDKILRLIALKRVQVLRLKEDANTYGEFIFLDLAVAPTAKQEADGMGVHVIQLYGLGEHFEGEKWLIDSWKVNSIDPWAHYWRRNYGDKPINRQDARHQLQQRYYQCEKDRAWSVVSLRDLSAKQIYSRLEMSFREKTVSDETILIPANSRGFLVNTNNGAVTAKFEYFDGENPVSVWYTFERSDKGEMWTWGSNKPKSERAQLFNLLALLGDDDGAHTELEDMGL